jgi:hypothetical protein
MRRAVGLARLDTFAGVLFSVIAVAWFALPAHRRLYASTFAVSLVLEIYGTWLEAWRWAMRCARIAARHDQSPGNRRRILLRTGCARNDGDAAGAAVVEAQLRCG